MNSIAKVEISTQAPTTDELISKNSVSISPLQRLGGVLLSRLASARASCPRQRCERIILCLNCQILNLVSNLYRIRDIKHVSGERPPVSARFCTRLLTTI